MKKVIASMLFTGALFTASHGQTSINNVPANASVVVRYSGENFSKNVPVKKMDSYSFMKQHLFKALRIDSVSSLENTGIDFEKDVMQYAMMEDSSMSFVTLFNLNNLSLFTQLVQANYQAEMRPVKKNGFEQVALTKNTYLGWNEKQAVMVYTSYQNNNNYYTSSTDTAFAIPDSAAVMVDTVAAPMVEEAPVQEEVKEAPVLKPKVNKGAAGKKKGGKTLPHKKTTPKKPAPKKEPVIIDEEVVPDNGYSMEDYKILNEDSIENAKREAWYDAQDKYARAKQEATADSIINLVFNGTVNSITTEPSYNKVVDPAAHINVWINYDNLMNLYWKNLFRGWSRITHTKMEPRDFKNNENKGFRNGMNIYFEKDKMRVEQNMYSPDPATAALGTGMYNNKQNNALAGFINPENIACMSVSMNTEELANYYYTLFRQYMNSNEYTSDYADLVDVYMDLLEIIIDEKAIAELMPGNMVMVLHDMKTKTVTYKEYVYDENFNGSEVTKTKEELSPNFTFAIETKREAFLQKVARLPVRYAEKGGFDYKDKGGYYELAFDADKYPISSLYFMVKDGIGIITTSKEVIDLALSGKGYKLDSDTKKGVLDHNVYMKIDSKKLIQQINPQLSTDLSKNIGQYLEENVGVITSEGGLKDGMIHGTTIMNITGNHDNSLEFFFNAIDTINDMMEKDKMEREKKID